MISDTDNKLIDDMARLWVDRGGDKDGVYYCLSNLANRVQELIDENNSRDELDPFDRKYESD